MSVTFREFGKTSDGRPIQLAELGSGSVKVEILNYGGIIRSMVVPSLRMEEFAVDIVLGYDTVAEYEKNNDFMGAVVGRFANRIGGRGFPAERRNRAHYGQRERQLPAQRCPRLPEHTVRHVRDARRV